MYACCLHLTVADSTNITFSCLDLPEETPEDKESTRSKKSTKKQGKHNSVIELSRFMSILEEVDERRKNIGREAHSCEEALKVAAVASPTTKQGSRCRHDAGAKQKAKYIMPYY